MEIKRNGDTLNFISSNGKIYWDFYTCARADNMLPQPVDFQRINGKTVCISIPYDENNDEETMMTFFQAHYFYVSRQAQMDFLNLIFTQSLTLTLEEQVGDFNKNITEPIIYSRQARTLYEDKEIWEQKLNKVSDTDFYAQYLYKSRIKDYEDKIAAARKYIDLVI